MAAFKQFGSLNADSAPVLVRNIIANSAVTILMNSLKLASGFATNGTTGALVFGHIVAHSTSGQVGLLTTGAAGAAIGSYTNSWTAASDNQTVAQVRAVCDISKFTLYSASSNGTLGTTAGSNLAGYTMDLADATQLAETSALTTTNQYVNLYGLDPADSTRVIVNIYESIAFGV